MTLIHPVRLAWMIDHISHRCRLQPLAVLAFDVQATIRKVDLDKGMVFFTSGQMDRAAKVAKDAKILDAQGKPLPDGLKSTEFKPGAVVTLSIEPVDGKPVIMAMRLGKEAAKTGGKKDGTFQEYKVDTTGLDATY